MSNLGTIAAAVFSVNEWGSHPDAGNDDCHTGSDFATLAEAVVAFAQPVSDRSTAFIELDGPGVHAVRANPAYNARERAREDAMDRRAAQHERAMEAGMGLGVEAYNEAMGWDVGSEQDEQARRDNAPDLWVAKNDAGCWEVTTDDAEDIKAVCATYAEALKCAEQIAHQTGARIRTWGENGAVSC